MDDDEDYSETFQPDLTLPIDNIAEFNEEQLKAYFQEARVQEIHAILNRGKKAREFYTLYWQDRERWNRDWRKACKDMLGFSHMTCWRYMQIHQQFGRGNDDEANDAFHDVGEVISADSLPTSTRTLVRLAEATKRDRETVVEAVKGTS
jgi:hypothetical protein